MHVKSFNNTRKWPRYTCILHVCYSKSHVQCGHNYVRDQPGKCLRGQTDARRPRGAHAAEHRLWRETPSPQTLAETGVLSPMPPVCETLGSPESPVSPYGGSAQSAGGARPAALPWPRAEQLEAPGLRTETDGARI